MIVACPGDRREPALAHELGEQLAVMDDLVAPAEVGVLVGERVEAVRAARRRCGATPGPVERGDVLLGEGWKTYSFPMRRAGSPLQASRGPRIAKSRPAARSSRAVARRWRRAPARRRRPRSRPSRGARAPARRARVRARRALRPGGAVELRLAPGVRGPLDVAQHRLGLGRKARLDHHEVAAQVDDVVDVLDRDRAGLDAGAAGHAVPDHLVAHRAGHERAERAAGERGASLGEELVADAHDEELRRERLAGRVGGAGVLAAAALGARDGVEHLLPGQVGDGARPEAELLVGQIEAQRLQPPPGAGARRRRRSAPP